MEKFREKFAEEANDLINELEQILLDLESQPKNPELIQKVFRVMHSLKGGSAMFGFNKMDKFTHHLENIYDLIRNNKLEVTETILDITLSSVDHLRNLLAEKDDNDTSNSTTNDLLMAKIMNVINNAGAQLQTDNNNVKPGKAPEEIATYYIRFKPNPDMFKFGTNPLYLIDDLCDLGQSVVFTRTQDVPDIEKLVPTNCYFSWDIFLSTNQGINSIGEIFIFTDNQCSLKVQKLSDLNLLEEKSFLGIIEETIHAQKEINVDQLLQLTQELEKVYNKTQATETRSNISGTNEANISSIRVSAEKLDNLINWVSELVTIQARLSLFAQETETAGLLPIAEEVEKISRRLRDDVFSIRLIPIENMLTRFQRLVRELSHELKKEVAFKTEGTDTELDKNIIESLNDPLMHIIRNSLDHGIETTEERKRMGKPEKGTILLRAYYSGTNVVIQISDDGKGINVDKIKEHAIFKGLIASDLELSRKEILNLIFEPGFSTAESVTKVSGRGVGMDVVRRKISEIRGEVDVESVTNQGTTITITLPLTLSIIDGLLVQIDTVKYIVPLSSVHKVYEFKHTELSSAVNRLIRTDNKEIAIINLRQQFKVAGDAPEVEHVVVVQYGLTNIGLVVDNIIGQYQAVLKPLGKLYKNQQSISGATILGDGTVALVMDSNKLIADFAKTETKIGG